MFAVNKHDDLLVDKTEANAVNEQYNSSAREAERQEAFEEMRRIREELESQCQYRVNPDNHS